MPSESQHFFESNVCVTARQGGNLTVYADNLLSYKERRERTSEPVASWRLDYIHEQSGS